MIPFNRPFIAGNEIEYIADAHNRGQLAGDGFYTKSCHEWLERLFPGSKALLTHSCTAALEMASLLVDIQPGDEVIMPSYTFVSTANAFVLRGAVPVFVDIRSDTLNINEKLIKDAITEKTKAIVVVHYAGVSCDMACIKSIALDYNLYLIEDAAQALMSKYQDEFLGGIGDIGCFSFHETKNIISGEGGALIINNPKLAARAEIIREKGTNRSSFFRGETSKYTWVDVGSSYLPGELTAAFLFAQLEKASSITSQRLELWNKYHEAFSLLSSRLNIQIPSIPSYATHNGHIYYLIFTSTSSRNEFIENMKSFGIHCVFHYIPLHDSPAGSVYSRASSSLSITTHTSSRIVRLPLYIGLDVDRVIQSSFNSLGLASTF